MAVSVGNRSSWRGRRRSRWLAPAALAAGAGAFGLYNGLAGSSPEPAEASAEAAPAIVEHVEGSEVARLTLSASAIKRLDLRTDHARNVQVEGTKRTIVPYAAVLYDANGQTWVYASPKPRTFVRRRITIDSIDGDRALLAGRPSAGMRVVTVGVQELWGAELGIDQGGH